MTKEVTGEVMGEVMGEEWECRLASSRRWSSCASSGASQPKSLAMRIPWKTSDENLTLRSRAAISCLVSFPRLRPRIMLSGIERSITPRPARPATPR